MRDLVHSSMPDTSKKRRTNKSLLSTSGTVARQTIFWLLTVGIAVASWRWVLGGVAVTMEQVQYHAELRPIALYTHIILAPVALILVPFQLWQSLRKSRPMIHRLVGRAYGITILFAGLSGLWLAAGTDAGIYAVWGFGLLAVAWLSTTGMGIALAIKGDYAGHRRWIIRSVAVTLSAVTLRLYIIPTEVLDFGNATTYQAISWLCWVPNLIAAELYLRCPQIGKKFQRSSAA